MLIFIVFCYVLVLVCRWMDLFFVSELCNFMVCFYFIFCGKCFLIIFSSFGLKLVGESMLCILIMYLLLVMVILFVMCVEVMMIFVLFNLFLYLLIV